MKDKVQIGGLYKIKKDKQLCSTEETLTKYVRLLEYAQNPLEKDKWYMEFVYVYKDSIEPTTRIFPTKILPYDTFFEYFELELTAKDVNKIIFERVAKEC